MDKEKICNILKKIVLFIGLITFSYLTIINIFYTSYISVFEKSIISKNIPIFILIIILLIFGISCLTNKISKLNNKKQKIVFITMLIMFIVFQVVWIIKKDIYPKDDQLLIFNFFKNLLNHEDNIIKESMYLKCYPYQLLLSFFIYLIYNIFIPITKHIIDYHFLQYVNVISNAFLVISFLLIGKELTKDDKQIKFNKMKVAILIFTFFSYSMLCTFFYGDFIGICFSSYAILFIIKYGKNKKIRNLIFSSTFMSLAYIIRQNNLIILIALFLYLILKLFECENFKSLIKNIFLIILFIFISILPSKVLFDYLDSKYQLKSTYETPKQNWVYIGLNESDARAEGWYISGMWGIISKKPEERNKFYNEQLSERINYLLNNPKYTLKFFVKKHVSTWCESTYQVYFYNNNIKEEGMALQDKYGNYLIFYQKALFMYLLILCLINITKNSNKISKEMLIFIMIFIGVFLFHTIWETKSRYILPYIIVLIPLASLEFENTSKKIKKEKKNGKVKKTNS